MLTKKITIFKILTVALVSVLCIHICTVHVNSALYYNGTCNISCTNDFSEDKMRVVVNIKCDSDVDSIDNCSITVTDSGNKFEKSWTGLSSNSSYLNVSKTASGVTKGETYTVTVTATLHIGNDSETVTETFTEKYE